MGCARKIATTVGIAFNLKRPSDDDAYEEYDEIETIEALQKELEQYGCRVELFEQDNAFLERISSVKVDFVVNIAEGRGTSRGRESQVPCILESCGIPYSGSDPVALGITLDKYLTGTILRSAGIRVPDQWLISTITDVKALGRLLKTEKRFIVKPRWEGSSKGIFSNSIVSTPEELAARVQTILRRYRQPALVESFVPGDEITAGVCGNRHPRLLGMMRIRPRITTASPFIYSIEQKHAWETQILYEPPQVLPQRIRERVAQCALRTFAALELRDIARIDFRLCEDGIPAVIDVNPLPGLSPRYSDLPMLCRLNGISYRRLVRMFLTAALRRYSLRLPVPTGTKGLMR
ncbi:MAG: ATP-grasp domain-containing protein [Desulfobacterota bacterium]|nr:ATP-grasp domain-containing protein [Thermodesulfobacteriota bacterium]